MMRRLTFLFTGLALAGPADATEKFWQQLTVEERVAAGLDRLTPEQQAALDQLADRFAATGASRAVDVAKAQAKTEAESSLREREAAQIGLTDPKRAEVVVSSRLVGTFRGWSGKSVFQLENGQTWVTDGPADPYTVSPQPGPAVEVRRSGFGGWKMILVSNGLWVRVKRLH